MLDKNKRTCDANFKYALWADIISTKRAIDTSPYQLMYGTDIVSPMNLTLSVMKLLHDEEPI